MQDAPPGVAFAGRAAGEFTARPRPRRLAARVLLVVGVNGAVTFALALRRVPSASSELLMVVSLMSLSVAVVGYAVRRARVTVDYEGVRWGWQVGGFRMSRERMKSVVAYRDAVALQPKRGGTWYLSARDWDRFERFSEALRRARIPFETDERPAPLGARMQSYGMVLDVLLVADAAASLLALLAAVSR